MKKAIIFLAFLYYYQSASSQTVTRYDSLPFWTLRDWADSFFMHVDVSHVPTGVLLPRAAGSIQPRIHQGLATDSPGTMNNLMNLYEQVYYGRVNNSYNTLPQVDSTYLKWIRYRTGSKGAISLLYAEFDTIKNQGPNDTPYYRIISGQLWDNRNRVDSPFVADTMFLAAINEESFVVGEIDFVFPSSHIFALGMGSYEIEANFGNNGTWYEITPDQIYPITYEDSGKYTITVRIQESSGRQFQSSFSILIEHGDWLIPDIHPTLTYIDHVWTDIYSPWGTKAYFYPSTNGLCLDKPFIFVEGFDPLLERGRDQLYRIINEMDETDLDNFYHQLRSEGYDIIIVDFENDNGAPIAQNALVLKRIIDYVNSLRCGNEPIVVSGFSMGGLVARYCLRKMENDCQEHHARLYISMDSPHLGANISLAMQYVLNDAYIGLDFFKPIADQYFSMTCPAAREMLVASVLAENGGITGDRTTLNTYFSTYGLPQKCRNIAFSLGNNVAANPASDLTDNKDKLVTPSSNWYTEGNQIFEWQLTAGNGFVHFASVKLYAVTTSSNQALAEINLLKLWKGSPARIVPVRWKINGFGHPYDSRPGSAVCPQYDLKNELGGFGTASCPNNRFHQTIIHINSAYNIVPETQRENDFLNETNSTILNNRWTDFDNISNEDNYNSFRHMRIRPGVRTFMLDEITATSYTRPTRHLYGSLSSTYNFGNTLVGVMLNSVDIESGGILKVNSYESTEWGGGFGPGSGSNFNLTSNPCTQIIIKGGGEMVLGDDIPNNTTTTTLTNGSVLDIRTNGILRIHNNCRLVIKEGASLIFNSGAFIYLEGPNAILEIEGTLTVKAGATFTFTKGAAGQGGYIIFTKTGSPGQKLITAESTTAKILLQGSSCTDKILELNNCTLTPEYQAISSTHYFSEVKIMDGHIKYNSNTGIVSGTQGEFSGLHLEAASGATNTIGLSVKGQTPLIIDEIKFNGLSKGMEVIQTGTSTSISISNCNFVGGGTGLSVTDNSFSLSYSHFTEQSTYAISASVNQNCTLFRVVLAGSSSPALAGLLVNGSSSAVIHVEESSINAYLTGIDLTGSGTVLSSECVYYTNNDVAVYAGNGTIVNLSSGKTFDSHSAGNSTFSGNDIGIQLGSGSTTSATLYLNSGNNAFLSQATTPVYITGYIPSTQDQLNHSLTPAQLSASETYFDKSTGSSPGPNYTDINTSTKDVNLVWSWTGSVPPVPCPDDISLIIDACTTASKKSTIIKINQFAKELEKQKLNTSEQDFQLIRVYPNPSQQTLTIELSGYQLKSLKLIDMNGKIIMEEAAVSADVINIDISNVAVGIYIVELMTEKGPVREKVSIVR